MYHCLCALHKVHIGDDAVLDPPVVYSYFNNLFNLCKLYADDVSLYSFIHTADDLTVLLCKKIWTC